MIIYFSNKTYTNWLLWKRNVLLMCKQCTLRVYKGWPENVCWWEIVCHAWIWQTVELCYFGSTYYTAFNYFILLSFLRKCHEHRSVVNQSSELFWVIHIFIWSSRMEIMLEEKVLLTLWTIVYDNCEEIWSTMRRLRKTVSYWKRKMLETGSIVTDRSKSGRPVTANWRWAQGNGSFK